MSDPERLALPQSALRIGEAAVSSLSTEPDASRASSLEQLRIIREEEAKSGRTLHKGQPLHNMAVVEFPGDAERARTLFHAAYVEDHLTFGTSALAGDVLIHVYGERPSALDELAKRALATSDDPETLAAQFEDLYRPFGEYHNYQSKSREEAELAQYQKEQLVFVAGAHGLFHHIQVIADGVSAAELFPVVVGNFKNSPDDNDFSKSARLLDACGSAIVDVSLPAGQYIELGLLYRAPIPILLVFVAPDLRAEPKGSGMVKGLAQTLSADTASCVSLDQMREESRAWVIKVRHERRIDPVRPTRDEISVAAARAQSLLQGGSNTRLVPSGSDSAGLNPDDWPAESAMPDTDNPGLSDD